MDSVKSRCGPKLSHESENEFNKYGGLAYVLLAVLWDVVPAFLNALLDVGLLDTLLYLGLGAVAAAVGFDAADRSR